jgi:hypothetical protein
VDVGYERWSFRSSTTTFSDTSTGLGFGGGILVGVYDDLETFKVNLGASYQSDINYRFGFDPGLLPAFDMPQQGPMRQHGLGSGVIVSASLVFNLLKQATDLKYFSFSLAIAESPLYSG